MEGGGVEEVLLGEEWGIVYIFWGKPGRGFCWIFVHMDT